jgi:predicted AlkP superfamily pyrophosphatase or phosphodiesterase
MTWPAHESLATGALPAHHGVVGNHVWDRGAGKAVDTWTRPAPAQKTLWQAAHAAGWTTAALLWPATTASAGLDWNLPEVYGQKAFESAASPGLLAELAQVGLPIARLGRHGDEEAFLLDSLTRDAAVHLIHKHAPRLMFVHFLSVDTQSHRYGPDAPEATWAMELVDRYLGDVLRAYEKTGTCEDLRVMVVSDHGFLPVTAGLSPRAIWAGLKLQPADRAAVQLVSNGHALFTYVTDPQRVARLLPLLHRQLAETPGIERVVPQSEFAALGLPLPATLADAPDLIAVARPEILFWNPKLFGSIAGPPPMAGMHGAVPDKPGLLGVFFASGPGVRKAATIQGMRVIDVAPTAARLLDLPFDAPDGKVRTEVLSSHGQAAHAR